MKTVQELTELEKAAEPGPWDDWQTFYWTRDRRLAIGLRNAAPHLLAIAEAMNALAAELRAARILAENQLAAEKLAQNRVKEEYWRGELGALHRVIEIVEKPWASAGDAGLYGEVKP